MKCLLFFLSIRIRILYQNFQHLFMFPWKESSLRNSGVAANSNHLAYNCMHRNPCHHPISLSLGSRRISIPLDHELFLHFSKCPTDSARNATQLLSMVSRTLVSGVAILRVDHNPAPYRLFNLNKVILSSLVLSLLTCKMGIIIAPLPVGGGGLMLAK